MSFNLFIIPLKQRSKTKNEYLKYGIIEYFFGFGQDFCLFATSAMLVDIANIILALVTIKRHSISNFFKFLLIFIVLIFDFLIAPTSIAQWYWYIPVFIFPLSKMSFMYISMKKNRIISIVFCLIWVVFDYKIGSPMGVLTTMITVYFSFHYLVKYKNL